MNNKYYELKTSLKKVPSQFNTPLSFLMNNAYLVAIVSLRFLFQVQK